MGKVYCKNCKYYIPFKYPNIERCKKIPNDIYQNEVSYDPRYHPDRLNENNNCMNYKRKWWNKYI